MALNNDNRQQQGSGSGGNTPAPKSRLSRIGGFFKPDFGTGPQQVREQHGMFLTILAMLFGSAGVLEPQHPYLQQGAKFTIGELFGATFARTDFRNRQRLPQTVYFCAVWGLLASSIIYAMTAILLFVAAPAHAYADDGATPISPTSGSGMFTVDKNDLAQQFINNLVMGKPVNISASQDQGKTSESLNGGDILQGAFRAMLAYYSKIILVVGSFLLLYHIINLLVSSAWSGKPLEGANHVWAPLRLVLAIGLLVPLGDGLNTGQHVVLKLAQVGSAVGTHAWQIFTAKLVANGNKFTVPDDKKAENEFAKMILVYACQYDINAQPTILLDRQIESTEAAFHNNDATQYVYVKKHLELYGNECGKIALPRVPQSTVSSEGGIDATSQAFMNASGLQKLSLQINKVVSDASNALYYQARGDTGFGAKLAQIYAAYSADTLAKDDNAQKTSSGAQMQQLKKDIRAAVQNYHTAVQAGIASALGVNASFDYMKNSSWIVAGGYYMQVSAYQHTVFAAATNGPKVEFGPVFGREITNDATTGALNSMAHMFNSASAKYAMAEQKHFIGLKEYYTEDVNQALFGDEFSPQSTVGQAETDTQKKLQKNNWLGFGNLISMDKSYFINLAKGQMADPFAALISVGNAILSVGTAAFAAALAAIVAGGVVGTSIVGLGAALAAFNIAKIVVAISFYLFTVGGALALLLPLVPVTKFLGAVITWMLAVMEAVIGMPLFALAHLTPGGNSLFEPAKHGYPMLLHIAIRPILIVFGMIVSMIIVTLAMYALNIMFVATMDSAWGDNEGGFMLALVLFGLWTFTAYQVVKKIFSFMDYVSHAHMKWFGSGGYGFERYGGDKDAIAAYAAFQTGQNAFKEATGAVSKLAGGNLERQKKAYQDGVGKRNESGNFENSLGDRMKAFMLPKYAQGQGLHGKETKTSQLAGRRYGIARDEANKGLANALAMADNNPEKAEKLATARATMNNVEARKPKPIYGGIGEKDQFGDQKGAFLAGSNRNDENNANVKYWTQGAGATPNEPNGPPVPPNISPDEPPQNPNTPPDDIDSLSAPKNPAGPFGLLGGPNDPTRLGFGGTDTQPAGLGGVPSIRPDGQVRLGLSGNEGQPASGTAAQDLGQHYQTLGVSPQASTRDINQAFRNRMAGISSPENASPETRLAATAQIEGLRAARDALLASGRHQPATAGAAAPTTRSAQVSSALGASTLNEKPLLGGSFAGSVNALTGLRTGAVPPATGGTGINAANLQRSGIGSGGGQSFTGAGASAGGLSPVGTAPSGSIQFNQPAAAGVVAGGTGGGGGGYAGGAGSIGQGSNAPTPNTLSGSSAGGGSSASFTPASEASPNAINTGAGNFAGLTSGGATTSYTDAAAAPATSFTYSEPAAAALGEQQADGGQSSYTRGQGVGSDPSPQHSLDTSNRQEDEPARNFPSPTAAATRADEAMQLREERNAAPTAAIEAEPASSPAQRTATAVRAEEVVRLREARNPSPSRFQPAPASAPIVPPPSPAATTSGFNNIRAEVDPATLRPTSTSSAGRPVVPNASLASAPRQDQIKIDLKGLLSRLRTPPKK